MRSALLNPIRFYDVTRLPNWTSRFPYDDNTTQRIEFIKGLNPTQFYKEFLSNQTLYLQFEVDTGDDMRITVRKYNENTSAYDILTTLDPVDVTPSGWIGNSIYSYSFTPLTGTYYLTFSDGLWSDVFTVISDLPLSKRLVEVKYSHSENDYGCIFDNSFTFTNYFQGQLIPAAPENEIEAYETDRGEEIKLQATPRIVYTLNLNEVHVSYIKHVNMIFSLDTIFINGIELENTEAPQVELVEKTDLCNITIKLYQVGNDYYSKR